jgi:tetratricopeptide (TPR) repeat protein
MWEAKSLFEFYDKIKGTPVVLQASIWPYRGGGSWIPINTGLPTVLGWDHHQRQQRYPEQVAIRSSDGGRSGAIRTIYNTPSIQEALDLLNRFHVTYIHIGTIERDGEYLARGQFGYVEPYMSEEGYAKFEAMTKLGLIELAYQNTGVIVYKMTAKGESGVVTGDPATVGGNVTIVDPRLRRLEDAIKSQPDNPQNHYNLGQYYYQRKEYDKALASFTRVIELSPDRVNPYHVLGDVYRDSGDNENALANYKKATEVNASEGERPAAFNKYGVALQALGRFDEALLQFEKTLQLNPRFNEAHFHRAEIFEAQGKKEAAIDEYQKTIAASPRADDFWAQRSVQKIRELKGN